MGKKPFDRDDDPPEDGTGESTKTKTKMESKTDPESGQLSKEGKPDGFHYSEHRTVDSKNNVVVNVHITAANVNDMTPVPEIIEEIKNRLGKLPKYMGFDAGYHSAQIAHLLEKHGIQGVIGYRRHTCKTPYPGNTDSNTIRNLTATPVPRDAISTGRPRIAQATGNIGATARIAKPVPGAANAWVKKPREGW